MPVGLFDSAFIWLAAFAIEPDFVELRRLASIELIKKII